mgnify:CR=1 FL=1
MINESFKDRIINGFLNKWVYLKTRFLKIKNGNDEPELSSMNLVFEDNFEFLNKNVWRIGQPWGLFHPGGPYQYYGDTSVYIEEGHLILDQKYRPTTLTTWENDNVYNIPYSVGLITSYEFYGYGFYEFVVKLPVGRGLWPAVWLTDSVTWPPEIDINESYSDDKGEYDDRIETNFHFNNTYEKRESSGSRKHKYFNSEEKIKFSCWWTDKFIKIYYNGHLVRQITSSNVLKWFKDRKMMIVLNNAIRPEYSDKIDKQTSKFHIYSVRVWQI